MMIQGVFIGKSPLDDPGVANFVCARMTKCKHFCQMHCKYNECTQTLLPTCYFNMLLL